MISEGDRKQGDDGTIYEYHAGQWIPVGHEEATDLPLNTVTVIAHKFPWWLLMLGGLAVAMKRKGR